jgi:hypothetical protein
MTRHALLPHAPCRPCLRPAVAPITTAGALLAALLAPGCGGGGAGADARGGIDADPSAVADASMGGGADAAGALCAGAGLLFCEDFEQLPLGPASSTTWRTEASAGELSIDATHARGARALRVSTTGNGRGRLLVDGLAPAGDALFGVAHLWVTAFPTAPAYAHFTLVELAGAGDGTLVRPVGGQQAPASGADPTGAFWGVGSDGGPTGDWTDWRRSAPAQAGRWVCVEFELVSSTAEVHVWLDGEAQPDLDVSRTRHGGNPVDLVLPAVDRAWFGWWLYQANPTPGTFEVWLDDLALGPTRLGCQ